MFRSAIFVSSAFVLAVVGSLSATELITNGNFESNTGGLPTSWTYITNGDGPSTLQNSANSPFTNIYPAGSNDALFTDGTSGNVSPILLQSFATQSSGTIYASWDFNLASLTNANYWTVQIDDASQVALRFDMDFNGTSGQFTYETSGGATGNVLSLSANTWYQVTIALNITTHTFTGTITPQSGSATPFSAAWRISTSTLNRFVIDDVNGAGQNANIQFDNVSVNTVAPVPEPSTIALSIFALGSALVARRIRRRAI